MLANQFTTRKLRNGRKIINASCNSSTITNNIKFTELSPVRHSHKNNKAAEADTMEPSPSIRPFSFNFQLSESTTNHQGNSCSILSDEDLSDSKYARIKEIHNNHGEKSKKKKKKNKKKKKQHHLKENLTSKPSISKQTDNSIIDQLIKDSHIELECCQEENENEDIHIFRKQTEQILNDSNQEKEIHQVIFTKEQDESIKIKPTHKSKETDNVSFKFNDSVGKSMEYPPLLLPDKDNYQVKHDENNDKITLSSSSEKDNMKEPSQNESHSGKGKLKQRSAFSFNFDVNSNDNNVHSNISDHNIAQKQQNSNSTSNKKKKKRKKNKTKGQTSEVVVECNDNDKQLDYDPIFSKEYHLETSKTPMDETSLNVITNTPSVTCNINDTIGKRTNLGPNLNEEYNDNTSLLMKNMQNTSTIHMNDYDNASFNNIHSSPSIAETDRMNESLQIGETEFVQSTIAEVHECTNKHTKVCLQTNHLEIIKNNTTMDSTSCKMDASSESKISRKKVNEKICAQDETQLMTNSHLKNSTKQQKIGFHSSIEGKAMVNKKSLKLHRLSKQKIENYVTTSAIDPIADGKTPNINPSTEEEKNRRIKDTNSLFAFDFNFSPSTKHSPQISNIKNARNPKRLAQTSKTQRNLGTSETSNIKSEKKDLACTKSKKKKNNHLSFNTSDKGKGMINKTSMMLHQKKKANRIAIKDWTKTPIGSPCTMEETIQINDDESDTKGFQNAFSFGFNFELK